MKAATTSRPAGYTRRNFTLRAETARLLDRLPKGVNRSRLVDEAIRETIGSMGRARLRRRLEEGYVARAQDSLRIAEEWFDVEEAAWQAASRARPKG